MTMANRHALEIKLKMAGARIYENVPCIGSCFKGRPLGTPASGKSGAGYPSHGNMVMHSHYVELAEDAGYHFGDTVHIMRNGEEMVI